MRNRPPSPRKKRDEIEFPIRIRLVVPEEGLGKRLDQMHQWLAQSIGQGDYGVNADSVPGTADALSIYLRSSESAERFFAVLDSLGMEVLDPRDGGWIRSS
jgi:hypothetical protein